MEELFSDILYQEDPLQTQLHSLQHFYDGGDDDEDSEAVRQHKEFLVQQQKLQLQLQMQHHQEQQLGYQVGEDAATSKQLHLQPSQSSEHPLMKR